MELEHIKECPVCNNTNFQPYLTVKDYTVSKNLFNIVKCKQCDFLFTNPRPFAKDIDQYYQSENYISHTNKSNNPINLAYKLARTQTLKWKYNLVQKYLPTTLLDYGCGTGHFLKYCAVKGITTMGFEPDNKARKIAQNAGITTYETLDVIKNKFDIITLWHVLEHVSDVNHVMQWLYNHLNKNGTLIIAVPNPASYDAKKFKQYWAAYDVPRHLYHFTKKTLEKLAHRHDFSVENIHPMKLDAYYISLLSNQHKSKRSKPFNSFITGLISNSYAKNTTNYSSLIYVLSPKNS